MTKEKIKEIKEEIKVAEEEEIKLTTQIELMWEKLSGKGFESMAEVEIYIKEKLREKKRLEKQLKEQLERLENEYI